MMYEIVNFYDGHEDLKPRHQCLYINDTFIVDWSFNDKLTQVNSEILKVSHYRNFFLCDAIKEIL